MPESGLQFPLVENKIALYGLSCKRQLMLSTSTPLLPLCYLTQTKFLILPERLLKKDTLIVIDIGDVRKEYGKKFEYLAEVWDGSKKEMANGYWRLDIIAQGKKKNRDVYPLVNEIYSQQDPNFTSRNCVILRSLELVFNATDKKGILAGDRDFDFKRLYKFCYKGGIIFIIRQKGNRDILGSEEESKEILKEYIHKIGLGELKLLEFKGKMKYFYLRYFPVKLPGMKEQFWVVVYKGAKSKEPVILLTNIPATDESKA
jgi:hypothetical protein